MNLGRRSAFAAAALVVLAGCAKPREPLATFRSVPDFVLTAQSGGEFHSADQLRGKVWLADFIYTTCPGPCPRMTQQMKHIQDALQGLPDVRLVSFTVDPDNDTPSVLNAYSARFGADGRRWFFLTGTKPALNQISYDAFMLSKVGGAIDHSTRFVLVDREGRIRKYYETGEDFRIPDLVEDVRSLL